MNGTAQFKKWGNPFKIQIVYLGFAGRDICDKTNNKMDIEGGKNP